jgi:Leucine-rich repeat (LRR) protein
VKTFQAISLFFLLTILSCSHKQDRALLSLAQLRNQKIYTSFDSLPKNSDKVYRLDLSKQNLKSLPEFVFGLNNLQELNLSENQLSELKGVEKLKNLQTLNIGVNRFTVFPDEINSLHHLKILDIYWNDINSFPERFYADSNIEELDLTSLFKFDFASVLAKIHRLKNLRKLNLGNNQVPMLTIDFSGLKNLQEFGYIRQDSINVRELLQKLSSCKRLKILHLSVNNIRQLPSDIALLDSLQNLNLFQNQLSTLPTEITHLKQLKQISLIDNPISPETISKLEKQMPSTNIIY